MAEAIKAHQQIRSFIDAGGYAPGDRLPAERELIDSLGMSRTTLRKGLDTLEREGTIWRHVGKGTFVASRSSDADSGFPELATLSQQVTPVQMMRARLALEPAIAREAAANASAAAVTRLYEVREKTHLASSWDAYEKNDDALHRAVAEAAGNILLLSLFDHLNQVRRAVAWAQVIRISDKPSDTHSSFTEHDLIITAIEARDPVAAHKAMRDHLNSVAARLYGDT